MTSKNKLDRSPANPACFPATDMSWQGNPATQQSLLGMSLALVSRMSLPLAHYQTPPYKYYAYAYPTLSNKHTYGAPVQMPF